VYGLAHRPVPSSGEGFTVAPGRAAATSVGPTVSNAKESDGAST
jgi:hypothetical protein